ncbi:glycosyltransferase 87 family protein [Sorangium sp. So ce429]
MKSSAKEAAPPREPARTRLSRWLGDPAAWAVLLAWGGTIAAFAQVRSALAVDPRWLAARTLWDSGDANINDPLPAIQAAWLLARSFHAPIYAEFSQSGSSFIYPPIAAALYTPLAGVQLETAAARLSLASRCLVAAILAVMLLFVAHGKKGLAARHVAAIAATMVAFYPLVRAVMLNQSTLVVTLLLGLGWLSLRKGAELAAGAALAAAIALKPQLVLMLPLLAWHTRRAVVAALASGCVLLVASLSYAGLQNHVDYVAIVLPALASGYAFYPNQSWNAFFQRLLTDCSVFRFEIAPPSAAVHWLSLAGGLLTYAVALLLSRRFLRDPALGPQVFGFAWLTSTLVSPVAWEHHYAPAIFVFVASWEAYREHGRALPARLAFLFVASFIAIASYFEVLAWSSVAARLLVSYVFYGGLLLMVASAALLLAHARLAP